MSSSLGIAVKVTFIGIIYIGFESLMINTQPLVYNYMKQLIKNNEQLKNEPSRQVKAA